MVRAAVAELASKANVVVLGGVGQFLFRNVFAALHVQIVASLPYRTARVMRLGGLSRVEAEALIQERDSQKRDAILKLHGANWRDPIYYDLVLNIDSFSTDKAVETIAHAAQAKEIDARPVELPAQLRDAIIAAKLDVAQMANLDPVNGPQPEFAHPSEREFASVMDFYRVRWEYEPRIFPIEWDSEGRATAAFTTGFLSS